MKITFLTFHNWETKRIGGFHKFAEACADSGHEVVFYSCMRPYFIRYKHEERLNGRVLKALTKGMLCTTEAGNKLVNCTWPTLRIPMPFYKYIPRKVNHWLNTHSLGKFKTFQNKFLNGTDVFVFESCDGIEMFDKIKRFNPNAKMIYRPSDPLAVSSDKSILEAEWHVMKESSLTLIVNQEGVELYRQVYSEFDKYVRWELLSNGVDTEKFGFTYPKPKEMQKDNVALYVGARVADWKLLLYSAENCPNIHFVIVCPEIPPKYFSETNLKNLTYIPGIQPKEVPAWITNCDVVIIPNPEGRWKVKPWGITAKYYQAMKAKKPIVAYEDTPRLKREYNVDVAYTKEDFVQYLNRAMLDKGERNYELHNKDWKHIKNMFMNILQNNT